MKAPGQDFLMLQLVARVFPINVMPVFYLIVDKRYSFGVAMDVSCCVYDH
jgi:hypothetical protein